MITMSIAICLLLLTMLQASTGLSYLALDDCDCLSTYDNTTVHCTGPCDVRTIQLVEGVHTKQGLRMNRYPETVVAEPLCVMASLQKLDLTHGNLQAVYARNFSCFPELTEVNLSYNNITWLDVLAFVGLKQLTSINLDHNFLTFLDPLTFLDSTLIKLQIISIASNKLKQLDTWPFVLPAALAGEHNIIVNVTDNDITQLLNTLNISVEQVQSHLSLQIDLRLNNLQNATDVDIKSLLKLENSSQLLPLKNVRLDMHQNSFRCDCYMYYLIHWLRPFLDSFESLPDLYFKNVVCDSPRETNGHLITSLPDEQFYCDSVPGCPENCACRWTPANDTVIVDCAEQPLKELPQLVPSATHVHLLLQDTQIKELQMRSYLPNVTVLDMGRSDLTSLDMNVLNFMPALVSLLVGNNDITTISSNFSLSNFGNLSHFDLCGNPLICDCHLVPFHSFLSEYSNKTDIVNNVNCIRCGDGVSLIQKLSAELSSYCEMHSPQKSKFPYMSLLWYGMLVLVSLVIGVVILLGYRYFVRIQMFTLAYFHRPLYVTSQFNCVQTYQQDIGLLYHESDEEYGELFEKACKEIDKSYKVFKCSDLAPDRYSLEVTGELIQSKTVFVVLSRSFLEDNRSIFKFRVLFDYMLSSNLRMKLIPIVTDTNEKLFRGGIEEMDIQYYVNHFPNVRYANKHRDIKHCVSLVKKVIPLPIPLEEATNDCDNVSIDDSTESSSVALRPLLGDNYNNV